VDLVHEQHIAGRECGEDGREVALALKHGAAGNGDLHAHLGRENEGERRLAEPRRAGQQHMVERLTAQAGRLQED
jgi:hypothetical protein